jgi:type VI secretion system protein VasD
MIRKCLYLSFLLLLSGCHLLTREPYLTVKVTAAGFINPDQQGRASPVVVDLYQLKATYPFGQLHYQKLTQDEGSALGGTLLDKQRIVIRPGNSYIWEPTRNAETRFIGVVVGYRDWVKRQAVQVIALQNKRAAQVRIHLKARGVTINAR